MAKRRDMIKWLRREIQSNMVRSEFQQSFLPEQALSAIFTLDRIIEGVDELECPETEKIGLAQTIREKGTRMFAILIKIGEEDLIAKFRMHEVLDAHLPLDETRAKEIAGDHDISFTQEVQRQFYPYKFRQDMRDYHRYINNLERILPFVGDPEHVASGGFGDVSRVNILPSQQEFIPKQNGPIRVIRKEIRHLRHQTRYAYDEMFSNELKCLLLLNRLQHPNIIRFFGSYTYGDKHCFLFQSYEMDLGSFLRLESRFEDFKWDFTFFSALRGLASALCKIHRLHLEKEKHGLNMDAIGYHHDFRPANVLVNRETFILADFGLAKLKPIDATSQTPRKDGQGDYIAPECIDRGSVVQRIGREIDVWAFGCLIIEVAIFMQKGAKSLNEFRKQRISETWLARWEDGCFHDKNESLKPVVSDWLDFLTRGLLHPGPAKSLANLSRKALKKEPEKRPKMDIVCRELTWISLQAHVTSARNCFHKYIESPEMRSTGRTSNSMKLYFGSERLAIFSYITGLDDEEISPQHYNNLNGNYEKIIRTLKNIAILIERLEFESTKVEPDAREGDENVDGPAERFENEICELVDEIWNILPTNEQRKAEVAWLRATLYTEDIRRLDDIERAFKVEDDPIYTKGAAMAMIKRIGVEIRSDWIGMPTDLFISESNVQRQKSMVRSHEIGLAKEEPVLIEWMYYSSGWEDIPSDQRAAVISRKAQAFSETSRPAGLRTLTCTGTFESVTDEKAGYGFIYHIPYGSDVDIKSSTATLLQLLENQKRQPVLHDKLRLAATLAQFIGDFHQVGWLHKSFYSENVLFFNLGDRERDSGPILTTRTLEQPYVVGFQESRPGGSSWHTSGPSRSSDFEGYQHPEYARTRRYRANYDYYSLGLILLELGFWKPLREWWKHPRYSKMSYSDFRRDLIERHVPYLGIGVGAVYRDAVQYCLSEDRDRSEEWASDVLDDFAKNVADPLTELADMRI